MASGTRGKVINETSTKTGKSSCNLTYQERVPFEEDRPRKSRELSFSDPVRPTCSKAFLFPNEFLEHTEHFFVYFHHKGHCFQVTVDAGRG